MKLKSRLTEADLIKRDGVVLNLLLPFMLLAGAYTPIPFACAQLLVEIPYVLVQTALYSVVTYFLIGFDYNAGTLKE